MTRRLLFLLLPLGALGLGFLARADAGPDTAEAAVRVFPWGLMDEVRRTDLAVPMQVQIYNGGTEAVSLEGFRVVRADGEVLVAVDLAGERLPGDGGRVADLYYDLELVDPEISHRHTHRIFLPEAARPELDPASEADVVEAIIRGVRRLQEEGAPMLRNLQFDLDLARLFPASARPGDEAAFDVVVAYRDAGGRTGQAVWNHTLRLLAPWQAPPAAWTRRAGQTGAWYKGDLHVHNCRDQAIGGCPEDCAAESFNITGSFSTAQLKSQFQALGFDWFSSSSHSYCISDQEFQEIANETTTLDEPSFKILCGTEQSGRETGRQEGGDSADWLCFLGFGSPTFHMGAHAITTRRVGGRDGFLDFCDNPLHDVVQNTSEVRAEGGVAIANHPAADYWAFNSTAVLTGNEAGGLHGVEIWNGRGASAGAGHKSWWIRRLLDDRVLYAYSGSDTHDAAFDFGATFAYVSGTFTETKLVRSLAEGRTYVSNGPFLAVTVTDNAGRELVLGDVFEIRLSQVPHNYPIQVHAFYNTGTAPATVRIYMGKVGDSAETLIQEFSPLTGGGEAVASTVLPDTASSWFRAELELLDRTQAAFTSPVFIRLVP